MLLPLAWLVRVKDTPEHRGWLADVAKYILEAQDASGAIVQKVSGHPITNAQYGAMEAPLIHTDGDPCTDLLYTTNFAFLGLHEAAAATGDAELREACDRLADFLVRAQARADRPAELDGAWFRGFDFRRWDYWGSNADLGWGVWSTETGWTQGWITSVLALRQLETSYWELTKSSRIAERFEPIRRRMLPDEALALLQPAPPIQHAAFGRRITLAAEPAPQYAANGGGSVVDGLLGTVDHNANWLGFHGNDLEATIDLKVAVPVRGIAVRCLQARDLGIFVAQDVDLAISADGTTFRRIATAASVTATAVEGPTIETIRAVADTDAPARFIRVRVRNRGQIPAPHGAAGQPAWLFVDEIVVNPAAAAVQP
jgi:hypothetical protein